MNYLGHLYFSEDHYPLMLANLYGDFVKGKNHTFLPEIVQKGVSLHRKIDHYIDHHPLVKEIRLKLYKELPKVAGIAVDLYFDHLLAKYWNVYHQKPLHQFVDDFFEFALQQEHLTFKKNNFKYPSQFIHLLTLMKEENWIKRYEYIEGLEMASKGLSRRISFPNKLASSERIFLKHQEEIHFVFNQYMKDAQMIFKT